MGESTTERHSWAEDAAPSSETIHARTQLSPAEIDAMLSAVTHSRIGTMTACGGFAYLAFAVGQWIEPFSEASTFLLAIYGLTGIALLAFSWRTKHQPLPIGWALHAVGVLFLVSTAGVTLAYGVSRYPQLLHYFAFLQFAAGALLFNRAWLLVVMICGDVGWAVVSLFVDGVDWPEGVLTLGAVSILTIGINITRRKTLVELHELRLAAERASEAKTAFLANMSHEVRTPMTGVLGLSSLLLETELDPKQERMATAMRDSAEALISVVDQILDFSQLQKGQIELERAPFNLRTLVDGVVDLMEPRARAKGLDLEADLAGLSYPQFVGDGGRLRQILLNFVSNAIKFTESGSITIRAASIGPDLDRCVRLSVEDSGIGISADSLEQIFNRYVQGDSQGGRRLGGAGLGLAISKQLVDLMGGELGVDSEVGRGTTFWAELALQPGPEHTLRAYAPPSTAPRVGKEVRVLVAEDNRTSRMVTKALLKKFDCEVDVAIDGREALEKARATEYDLILMDCYMPMMDGFQASRRIREQPGRRDVPIVALTASVTDVDRARCLDAGMNDVVVKPVHVHMLTNVFNQWVRRGGPALTVPGTPTPSPLDMKMVRQLVSFDEEDDGFIEDVMVAYIDQLRDSVDALTKALDAADMKTVHATAHSIKGASKQLGVSRVGELLGAIEREEAVEPARDLLTKVAAEVPKVEEAVQALLRRQAS